MPLIDLNLITTSNALPPEVANFIREADSRGSHFDRTLPSHVRGFVPCDLVTLYQALRSIAAANLACGNLFCEWGSGMGGVASLAAMMGFDAYGIEIDQYLCRAAQELADDFSIPAEFINGSFIPPGADKLVDQAFLENDGELSLDTRTDDAYFDLGLDLHDFDIVFVFPWPNDEQLMLDLFEQFAADGALLLTYNELDSARLRRKVG